MFSWWGVEKTDFRERETDFVDLVIRRVRQGGSPGLSGEIRFEVDLTYWIMRKKIFWLPYAQEEANTIRGLITSNILIPTTKRGWNDFANVTELRIAAAPGNDDRVGERGGITNWTKIGSTLLLTASLGLLMGCQEQRKSPDVTDSVRRSLDQAGLKDVSVSQDRDKGVVTLSGTTTSDTEKAQAESIPKTITGSKVVANQIAVRPPGDESTARDLDSALDKGIKKNLDAQLIQNKWNHDIKYDVKNRVVTLKGEVNSEGKRSMTEKVTASVPNVKQIVNEIEVKNRKPCSSSSSR